MRAKRAPYLHSNLCIFLFAAAIASLALAACATIPGMGDGTALPLTAASPAPSPTPVGSTPTELQPTSRDAPTASPTPSPSAGEDAFRVYALGEVTVYSGPGDEHPPVGILETGAAAEVTVGGEGNWLNIVCPDDIAGACWVLWDPNSLYPHEGPPLDLNVPDAASLKFETVATETSPDGRWQALVTQSETVLLAGEEAWFFYVELQVTSLEDGVTWTPLSEWHAAGLGEEYPPKVFHWSQDGRYLYYTSLFDLHGACVSMNIGESLDRLDLTDGRVAAIQPPRAFRILAISPDETMLAHLSGQSIVNFTEHQVLVVRDLATAYGDSAAGQDSVLWQIPLDIAWPTAVSEITWSPDSGKLLVTAPTMADDICNQAGRSTWELDIETGVLTAQNIFIPESTPTPTPPTPCPIPDGTAGIPRETFLIFCGGEDHVNIPHNDSLVIDGGLTAEAYVNYLGGGGEGPRVIEIIDTFNISFSEGKVWFCLFSQEFETNQGNGWHCLSHPQPELNQWVHLAGSWDGENMYLFIDGELKAETAFPGPLFHGGPDDQNLRIGNGWTLIDGFHGFIDEVRLSSTGRYSADFAPQSQLPSDEYTAGLWHFDEGQGTLAADESSHENLGVLSPFVRWGTKK